MRDLAAVLDEAQFPELVHEQIDPGTALCQSSPPASLAILWEAPFEDARVSQRLHVSYKQRMRLAWTSLQAVAALPLKKCRRSITMPITSRA
jgi:hypothetical protein